MPIASSSATSNGRASRTRMAVKCSAVRPISEPKTEIDCAGPEPDEVRMLPQPAQTPDQASHPISNHLRSSALHLRPSAFPCAPLQALVVDELAELRHRLDQVCGVLDDLLDRLVGGRAPRRGASWRRGRARSCRPSACGTRPCVSVLRACLRPMTRPAPCGLVL